MSTLSRVARNASMSAAMNLVNRAAGVVAFTLLARTAGPVEAGTFSLALTYLVIFSALTWGLDELVVRQVARRPASAPQFLGGFLALRLVVSLALYGGLALLVSRVLPYTPGTARCILLVGLSLITDSLGSVAQAVFMALERFEAPLAATSLAGGSKLLGCLLVLALGGGLEAVAWVWVAGSLLGAGLAWALAIRAVGLGRIATWLEPAFWRPLWRPVVPFLVIGLLTTLEYQTDVVILSLVRGEADVGWYGGATTFLFALTLISQAFRMAIYPLMARYQAADRQRLIELYERSLRYLAWLALPLATGLALLAPQFVRLVYGPGFEPTASALRLLAWSVIFIYLNVPNARLMLVSEEQGWASGLLVGSLTANIALNLILAPRWGASAAALARTVSTATLWLGMSLFAAVRLHRVNLVRLLARPVLASLAMAGMLWWLADLNLFWLICIGAAVYLVALFALGGVPSQDRQTLSTWLRHAGLGPRQ